jgi:ABC-type transport system substrate-binding protein
MRSDTVSITCAWIAASMRHGTRIALGAALLATCVAASAADAAGPGRALRVGIPMIPDALDPARADSMLAWYVMAGIYDTLYVLDPLARPAAIVPLAATSLPEVSADHRTFTIRVRPGIRFTPTCGLRREAARAHGRRLRIRLEAPR